MENNKIKHNVGCARCGNSMRGRPRWKYILCKKCDDELDKIYGKK